MILQYIKRMTKLPQSVVKWLVLRSKNSIQYAINNVVRLFAIPLCASWGLRAGFGLAAMTARLVYEGSHFFHCFSYHSFRIIHEIYFGENNHSVSTLTGLCFCLVSFFFFFFPQRFPHPQLPVILITGFHWQNHTTNGSMLRACRKAKVSSLLHSRCQDKTADGNSHTIFKYKYS